MSQRILKRAVNETNKQNKWKSNLTNTQNFKMMHLQNFHRQNDASVKWHPIKYTREKESVYVSNSNEYRKQLI